MDKRTKILVIEDEDIVANVIQYVLEQEGYDVFIAFDGQDGLEKARLELPDMIILDLCLPKLPGEEVCKAIRSDERMKNTPIIMVTGKNLEADKIVGKVVGANAYITKPFKITDLLEEIKKHLPS